MVTGPLKSPAERVSRIPAIGLGSLYSPQFDAMQVQAGFPPVDANNLPHNWITPTIQVLSTHHKTAAVSARSIIVWKRELCGFELEKPIVYLSVFQNKSIKSKP